MVILEIPWKTYRPESCVWSRSRNDISHREHPAHTSGHLEASELRNDVGCIRTAALNHWLYLEHANFPSTVLVRHFYLLKGPLVQASAGYTVRFSCAMVFLASNNPHNRNIRPINS